MDNSKPRFVRPKVPEELDMAYDALNRAVIRGDEAEIKAAREHYEQVRVKYPLHDRLYGGITPYKGK